MLSTFYSAISTHEKSRAHESSVSACIAAKKRHDMESLVNIQMIDKRVSDVKRWRDIITRLMDIVIFIGRQGLAYRGREETPADLHR